MHYGGVWFWYALLVMIPWFIGLLGLFGVVRIFRDIGNRFSSIAIMLIDMGMVQCIIRLVNKPMSAAARGIMFGNASVGISIFFPGEYAVFDNHHRLLDVQDCGFMCPWCAIYAWRTCIMSTMQVMWS
jgi:hypothetical protein